MEPSAIDCGAETPASVVAVGDRLEAASRVSTCRSASREAVVSGNPDRYTETVVPVSAAS